MRRKAVGDGRPLGSLNGKAPVASIQPRAQAHGRHSEQGRSLHAGTPSDLVVNDLGVQVRRTKRPMAEATATSSPLQALLNEDFTAMGEATWAQKALSASRGATPLSAKLR